MTTPAERNRALVGGAFDARTAGRGGVFDLLADDATWTIMGSAPGAGTFRGGQAYIDAAVMPLFNRLAEPTIPNPIGIWAGVDQVLVRWTRDTRLRAGSACHNGYAWFFTFRGGRAADATAFLAAHDAVVRGRKGPDACA